MSNDELAITIDYLTADSGIPARRVLSTEDYFEHEDDGSPFTLDSVPRLAHAREYLNLAPKELVYTTLVVSSGRGRAGDARVIRESYWNEGQCCLIERHDGAVGASYAEMILELPGEALGTWQIIRLVRENDFYVPCSHVILTEKQDGAQEEKAILTGPSRT